MPICIECSYPVPLLYSTYSRADDRSLGKGVRLTQCPRCQRFADKYVEYDFVVLFIDLVLIKPQVCMPFGTRIQKLEGNECEAEWVFRCIDISFSTGWVEMITSLT